MANYSKACPHENITKSLLSGNEYCMDCGADTNLAGETLMEERLYRARQVRCSHEETGRTELTGRSYCLKCGTFVPEPASMLTGRMEFTEALGPIRLEYAAALGDAKSLNWRKIPPGLNLRMPTDKSWFAAWVEMPWGATESRWHIERVEAGQPCPALAVWWSDDLLGLPPLQ